MNESNDDRGEADNEEMSLAEALLSRSHLENGASSQSEDAQDPLTPLKANGEKRWCRKCWAPKPERAHHCSECNRCVLKMGLYSFAHIVDMVPRTSCLC
jgi:palmitoyltransferase